MSTKIINQAAQVVEVTISPCGHVVCSHDFMGCVYDFRKKMGIVEADIPESYPPGSIIIQKQVSDTGFPKRDYKTIEMKKMGAWGDEKTI